MEITDIRGGSSIGEKFCVSLLRIIWKEYTRVGYNFPRITGLIQFRLKGERGGEQGKVIRPWLEQNRTPPFLRQLSIFLPPIVFTPRATFLEY